MTTRFWRSKLFADNKQRLNEVERRLNALSETERNYRTVVENSSDGIARISRDLKIIYLNRRLRAAFNISEALPNGLALSALKDDELRSFLEKQVSGVVTSAQMRITQQRIRLNEQNLYADWRLIPELDEDGQVETVLVIARDVSAIIEANEALRKSEHRMRRVFESSPVGIALMDDTIRPAQVNPALCRMLGYQPEELRGISQPEISFAEDMPEIEARAARFWADGQAPAPYVRRYRRKDGSALWAKVSSSRIPATAEQPELIMAVIEDLTPQKQAEDNLSELNSAFLTAFDANPAPVCINDYRDGTFRYVNSSFERLFGYSRDEIVGRTLLEVPLLTAETLARLSQALEGRTGVVDVDFEIEARSRQGLTHYGVLSMAPVSLGSRRSLISVFLDITERRRAEHELMRMATITEQAEESIIAVDTEGTIQYVNRAYATLSGYHREEVLGYNILSAKDDLNGKLPEVWQAIISGQIWRGQLCRRRKDGSHYMVEAKILPVKDGENRTIGYVAVERDITKELDLEKKLIQAQKMEAIGTLAGGIAHDFNNILSPIIGYTEITKAALPIDSPLQRNLSQVLKASERAKDMIRHILTFSRQSEQALEPINLQPIIKEGLKLMRATLPTTIAIEQELDSACGAVMADATQINQIIMNLCTNAYHAMPEGGCLLVTLDEVELDECDCRPPAGPGRFVRLRVSDTGHGMAPEIVERIFDPYFTTKGPGKGTGLGLSVVHGVVTRSGGQITVESQPGSGSTFSLYFPRVGEARSESADYTEGGVPRGHENVLLVDDDPMLLEMMRELLEYLGYQVVAKASGREALELFRHSPTAFDLIITDQTMPGLTGAELARALLVIRPDIPIILSTGYSDVISEDEAKRIGIRAYVLKPVVMDELARTIRQILKPA